MRLSKSTGLIDTVGERFGESRSTSARRLVGVPISLRDSSVRGQCLVISQFLKMAAPFTVERVVRIATPRTSYPRPSRQNEVESRGFVWNGNSSTLSFYDALPEVGGDLPWTSYTAIAGSDADPANSVMSFFAEEVAGSGFAI